MASQPRRVRCRTPSGPNSGGMSRSRPTASRTTSPSSQRQSCQPEARRYTQRFSIAFAPVVVYSSSVLPPEVVMKRRQAVVYFLPILLLISISCWSQGRQPSGGGGMRTLFAFGPGGHQKNRQPPKKLQVDMKKLTGEVVSTSFTRTNGEFDFSGVTNG